MAAGIVLFGGVGKVARKTVFGIAALCGNSSTALNHSNEEDFTPKFDARSQVSAPEPGDFLDRQSDLQVSLDAKTEFTNHFPRGDRSVGILEYSGQLEDTPNTKLISIQMSPDIAGDVTALGFVEINKALQNNLAQMDQKLLGDGAVTILADDILYDDIAEFGHNLERSNDAISEHESTAGITWGVTGGVKMSPQPPTAFAPLPQTSTNPLTHNSPPGAAGLTAQLTDTATPDLTPTQSAAEITGEAFPVQSDLLNKALLSRGGLTLSGGYSSIEGPNTGIRLTRSNIGGLNRELTAAARYSKILTSLELGYGDGNFLGSKTAFAPSLFANQQSARGFGSIIGSAPFKQSAYGININFNRKFESGFSATANYRLSANSFAMQGKNALCDSAIFGSPVCGALGKSTSSVVSFALTLDRRDNAVDPTRGFKLRFTQDLAGLGGSTRFARTRMGATAHIDIAGDWNVSIGAETGVIQGFGRREISPFDRFFMNSNTMRGFDLRSIGPKIRPYSGTRAQSVAIGGNAYYAARAELSVPVGGVFEKYGVRPSTFIDVGSVFGASYVNLAPGETLIGNSAKPRIAVGVGLSVNTPAGKLRLDFAKAIKQQIGDRQRMLNFSFGAAF